MRSKSTKLNLNGTQCLNEKFRVTEQEIVWFAQRCNGTTTNATALSGLTECSVTRSRCAALLRLIKAF